MIKQGMFKIALAAALAVGAASLAVAAPDTDPKGGFRELPMGADRLVPVRNKEPPLRRRLFCYQSVCGMPASRTSFTVEATSSRK